VRFDARPEIPGRRGFFNIRAHLPLMPFPIKSARVATSLALAALLAACGGNDDDKSSSNDDTPPAAELPAEPTEAPRVAFMPDIHFHDVYATFEDGSFQGVTNPANGKNATIRTMYAQLTSTRLFNENYFAFLAALDDAVARGVKLIALPGDFSDDGQPVHMRGLVKIMDDYAKRYGLQFFAAPGNHDPNQPLDTPNGKNDYLGYDPVSGAIGFSQKIYSRGANDCAANYADAWTKVGSTYCTQEVVHQGYAGITDALAQHGLQPRKEYLYYETPYSTYKYEDYSYELAQEQAGWSTRQYEICAEGAGGPGKPEGYHFCKMVADTSYVVEPIPGVWLVGIDANVYVPKGDGPNDFNGSGDAGYNKMLTHKPHVIAWLKDVVARGKAQGKQVVAFSHFPMSEFFNGASDDIEALLGTGKMQMVRRPAEDTTRALAETGLKVHVGGHMHFNDMALHTYDQGNALFNIQAPSMAAYVPAYKVMTLHSADDIEVETVKLDQVPRFDELFPLYRQEYEYTKGSPIEWSDFILDAKDYGDFNHRYMTELVRLRLLKDDWRCEMRELVKSPLTGTDMLVLSQLQTAVSLKELAATGDHAQLSTDFYACLGEGGGSGAANAAFADDMARAEGRARALAQARGMRLEDLAQWKAIDLAGDFVRLANAGDLAFADIPASRAEQYKLLALALQETDAVLPMTDESHVSNAASLDQLFQARFKPLMAIMLKLAKGAPSEHIRLDLANNAIVDLSGKPSPF